MKMNEKIKLRTNSMSVGKECNFNPEAILREYISRFEKETSNYKVFMVWACKTLQNRKWIMATDRMDDKLYEITYNGEKREYYLDEYTKLSNTVITVAKV